jgi:hypothetical protein
VGERTVLSSGLPCFPSGRHFHGFTRRRRIKFFLRQAVDLAGCLAIATLFAVGLNLRLALRILLCLDDGERMSQTLVLDDGGVADSLVFAEDAVGKYLPFPSHLQAPIGKVVQVDVLTAETFRDIVPIEDDLLAGVGHWSTVR